MSQQFQFVGIFFPKRAENKYHTKHSAANVHIASLIHNSPKVETTQMSTKWINEMHTNIQSMEYYLATERGITC